MAAHEGRALRALDAANAVADPAIEWDRFFDEVWTRIKARLTNGRSWHGVARAGQVGGSQGGSCS